MSLHCTANLEVMLIRLAASMGCPLDRMELEARILQAQNMQSPAKALKKIFSLMQLPAPIFPREIDPSMVPLLAFHPDVGWCIVRGIDNREQWVAIIFDDVQQSFVDSPIPSLQQLLISRVQLRRKVSFNNSKVFALIRYEFMRNRRRMFEVILSTFLINVLVTVASFYSMQVYDRVIPNNSMSTLIVLTIGVVLANGFEFLIRLSRTEILDHVSVQVDRIMVRRVFHRLLSIRLDQFPTSVGSLSGELRGYESVKGFLSTSTLFLLVDAPFGLLFLVLMASLGGLVVTLVPLGFLLLSVFISMLQRHDFDTYAGRAAVAANKKTGLLVETIESAELVKASAGGWRMLSRWMDINDESRTYELRLKRSAERTQFLLAFAQQMSYVALLAVGAYEVSSGAYTTGALIASSILSGRVLGPVAAIPGMLMQWAQTRASLQGLDRLWSLQDDHHNIERPLMPDAIRGEFIFDHVKVRYPGTPVALSIDHLHIAAGEKVGVIGPIGAGKTTFLRALSGMYKPCEGRITLDGLDLAHIARPIVAQHLAFLAQEGRLISGTLRDNLLIGLADPGDSAIMAVAAQTGLMGIIRSHPKGLDLPITEGGMGLSGGQKQLVHLTRLVLSKPLVWLLDEPTASMDRQTENQSLRLFQTTMGPEHTLILVTHKPEMLALVDRVIVVVNHRIVLDGEKNAVLAKLQSVDVTEKKENSLLATEENRA